MRIIENPHLTQQYRFPRSKKKRTQKKWAKRPENFRASEKIIMIGDSAVCSPMVAERIRKEMDRLPIEERRREVLPWGILSF